MSVYDMLKKRRDEILRITEKHGAYNVRVFGSVIRGDDIQESDIDFLVEFEPMQPVDHAKAYFGLLEALQNTFFFNIDLVEIKAVANPYLLRSINENRRQIYAA